MNILFYTAFNQRSRDTESLMEAFVAQGHKVFLLTQAEEGPYHETVLAMGVNVFTHVIKKRNAVHYFFSHTRHLIKFCRQHSIDVVYAHLETAALPAVLSQYFISAKVFACRHIIDEAFLLKSRNFIRLNKIVYSLARNIIVVSQHCKDFMIAVEKIPAKKIRVINLAYNFELYKPPVQEEVQKIKTAYKAHLLMITACRLLKPKRADLSVQVAKQLAEKGLDVKLLILGSGPEAGILQSLVNREKMQDHVFLLGYKTNIADYISASDLLVHPSVLDSSSVIIKEAGLQEKTVIACSGIGDVDEYLIHSENAFLVSKENTVSEMTDQIAQLYQDKNLLVNAGKRLKKSILERFSIKTILVQYDQIHNSLPLSPNARTKR